MTLACGTVMLCTGILVAGNAPTTAPSTAPATAPGRHMGPHPMMPPHATTSPASTRTAEQKKQEDIDRVMEFFKRTQPDVYDQATALRSTDPMKFNKLILSALPTVNQLDELRKTRPALFEQSMKDLELGYQSLRLAHELKRTDLSATDRKQMTDQLRMTVTAEFDVQQKIRRLEIDDLQSKVKDLDDQVKARDTDKDAIIQKRTDDLTQGMPRLEW